MAIVLYPILILVCGGVLMVGMTVMGSFTQPEVAAWQRICVRHGYAPAQRDPFAALARYVPGVRRLLGSFDIATLLLIAQRPLSVSQFWARLLGKTALVIAVTAALDIAAYTATQNWVGPLWVCVLVGGCIGALDLARLRRQAASVRRAADLALGDLLLLITSVSGGQGLPLDRAVSYLSETVRSRALYSIVANRGWERLVKGSYENTADLYDAISEAFGIPTFRFLASAQRSVRLGMDPREVYTRLALLVYDRRLLNARLQGARARLFIVIPVALMILPLIALILAPAFSLILGAI
jgi:hypothetical protein